MANWASTDYAIEGPKEVLERIEKAILDHPITEGADEHWEGDILDALGCKWVSRNDDRENGKYMRGFTSGDPWWAGDDHTVLRFSAEEAWGVTDFDEVLMENFPDVKVYYSVVEDGEEIFATNDKEGKYFPDRFYVDTCIEGNYQSEYFEKEEAVWNWLSKLTGGRIKDKEEVDKFNESADEEITDDFIYIHAFEVLN